MLIPGVATEWKVDDADKTKWVFKLRPGVKFHDGSSFNADAIVWNVQKVLDKAAPHFDPSQVGVTASRMPTLRIARKIDDMTVELTTSEPDAFLPINLTNLFMASPAHWEAKLKAVPASVTDPAERSKQAWAAFAADPSGSGPFRVTRFVSRERLELAKFPEYWDEKRRPKIDKVVLLPLPEANARTAALLSGQVDWIEAPAPDAVPQIKQRGFVDLPERAAACLAVAALLRRGLALARQARAPRGEPLRQPRRAEGAPRRHDGGGDRHLQPGHPWRGNPKFQIKYDPAAAKKLMQEAGHSAGEAAQGEGADLRLGLGPDAADADERVHAAGAQGVLLRRRARRHRVEHAVHQLARGRQGPDGARRERHQRHLRGDGPVLRAWCASPRPRPSRRSRTTGATSATTSSTSSSPMRAPPSTPRTRDAALAKLHARIVEEAPFVWVAHDVGPRAMSAKVKDVVQPQSWFIDLATMTME